MTFRAIAALCCAVWAVPAAAQAGEAALDFEALRACATLVVAHPDRDPAFAAKRAALDAVRERIAAERAAIEAWRPQVDPAMFGEVALFNDRVKRACAEFAAYAEAANALAETQNAVAQAFNADCADRDYDPRTLAALPAALRSAWSEATGSVAAPVQMAALQTSR